MAKTLSEKVYSAILETQKKKTVRHNISVAFTALSLARTHGLDPVKAFAAGEAHDMAKKVPVDLARTYLSSMTHPLVAPLDEFEFACEGLLHGPLAALFLAREMGMEDREMLEAIRYHSTGHPQLNPLGQVLMIADYVEPLRPWEEEAQSIRSIAERNLLEGWRAVLTARFDHFEKAGAEHHPNALAALGCFEQGHISERGNDHE